MGWIALDPKDVTVKAVVQAAIPGHKGRKFYATIHDKVHFYGAYWDEGSKNEWHLVRLADMKRHKIADHPYFRDSAIHDQTHEIPDGFVVVKHHIGRSDYVEIIAPASVITPLLPAPIELSRDEQIVLIAFCSLKSSYGGIKDFRRYEAKERTGITNDRYDAAKASLVAKGYLTDRNSVTIDGRNARDSCEFSDLFYYSPKGA